jgi:hypothetical protein
MLRRELLDAAGNRIFSDLLAVNRGAPAPRCDLTASSPREDLWRFRCSFPSSASDAPLANVRGRNTCRSVNRKRDKSGLTLSISQVVPRGRSRLGGAQRMDDIRRSGT